MGRFAAMVCDLPARQLLRVWNGYYPGRSGEIQIVPKEPNFMSGGLSHAGPWDYLQEVPMLWYGPGQVPAKGAVGRAVTMADVAPTIASFLGYEFDAPGGRPLEEVLPAESEVREPPRLILVVVWDGGGRNVLAEYPGAWPGVKELIPKGVWFDRFTLGSSPSVTPATHTTLGTGAYPRHHGAIDLRFQVDGRLVPSFENGPQFLVAPSLADRYDADLGNEPEVGVVAFKEWHLGMIGHGSFSEGGDRDLAALLDAKTARWALQGPNAKYFELPSYANEVPGLQEAIARADASDGARDGAWLGEEGVFEEPETLVETPAFAEWQTGLIEEIIRREGFGDDPVPDLLFTNYKQIDDVGHRWTMNSRQMKVTVRSSDLEFTKLIEILDREVGEGRWVIALTADHGVTPKPSVSGAFPIRNDALTQDINATFGGEVVRSMRPSQLWIDLGELNDNGYQLAQVAEYIARYTKRQSVADPSTLTAAERTERVFAAAFPSRVFERGLPCLPRSDAGAEGGSG
jgi:predicted AlkP superfamily pyrophosphatase or phosphodiesterase